MNDNLNEFNIPEKSHRLTHRRHSRRSKSHANNSLRRKSSKKISNKFLRGATSRLNKIQRLVKGTTGYKQSYEKPFEEMDESTLRKALKDSISDHKKIALSIYSKAEKMNLIQKPNFIRDSRLKKLVKIALNERDLDILIKILKECKNRNMFVDHFVSTNVFYGQTIPYCIAGFAEMPVSDKKRWIETLLRSFPYKFDLNRDVSFGGNLLYNSFKELHIHNIEWYSFLIDIHVYINSKNNKETILDKIKELKDDKLNDLQSYLESKGAKTSSELKN